MDASSKISTGTALYYPYILPRDINRVKAALIFWDRVRRIVPPSAQDGKYAIDDDDDAKLLADEDLLVATPPEGYEEAAAERFFSHIGPAADAFTIDFNTAKELAARNRGIHIEKIGDQLLRKLEQREMAHRFGAWVSMHDEVGALYMFCLASEMSAEMQAPLLSELEQDAEIGQSFLFEPHADTDVTNILLRAGIRLPGPADLSTLSTKEVAAFARRRAAERLRFRNVIEGILEVVRSADDPHAVNDYLDTQRIEIKEAVSGHRETLDELKVGAARSAATITIPAAVSAGIAALPISTEAAGVLAATGLVVAAIACYAETRGRLREARRGAPYHYLVSVEKELGVRAVTSPSVFGRT